MSETLVRIAKQPADCLAIRTALCSDCLAIRSDSITIKLMEALVGSPSPAQMVFSVISVAAKTHLTYLASPLKRN